MLYVLSQDHLFELPTAVCCLEPNGNGDIVEFVDESGAVIARFDRTAVLAFSSKKEKMSFGLAEERERQKV